MLKITNQYGQSLELNKNTSITVERINPLFSTDDSFIQDVTYNATAGLTPNNIRFISSGHLVEAKPGAYEMPVQVFVSDFQFYKAIFTYKIVKNQIEYVMKVNFGSIVSKIKTTYLSDIYTDDAITLAVPETNSLQQLMMDSCMFPDRHPFAFFPIKNPSWRTNPDGNTAPWINQWDHAAQKFVPHYEVLQAGIAPFYKLSYILKKIFAYLKLDVGGEAFSSKEFNEIYIYTRNLPKFFVFESSLTYMPKMYIIDFLKQIKDRLKLSMDFDLMTATVMVETAETVMASDCIDISEYIETIDEISTSEKKGYRVTLKADDSDLAANIGTEENELFVSPYSLVVGSGENKVELEVGTLTQVDEPQYSYPSVDQQFDDNYLGTGSVVDEFQIRLIRFKGMKILPGNKRFPEATSMPLTIDDATWYRFLNDSKKVVITAKIPPRILAKLKSTSKIGCASDKGVFFYALQEKNTYSMGNVNTERISVKIEARPLVADYKTKAFLASNTPLTQDNGAIFKYKGYWNLEQTSMRSFYIQATSPTKPENVFDYSPVDAPTDDGGVGGTTGVIYHISGDLVLNIDVELRLFSTAVPQYFIANGYKGSFTYVNGYHVLNWPSIFSLKQPIWVVF